MTFIHLRTSILNADVRNKYDRYWVQFSFKFSLSRSFHNLLCVAVRRKSSWPPQYAILWRIMISQKFDVIKIRTKYFWTNSVDMIECVEACWDLFIYVLLFLRKENGSNICTFIVTVKIHFLSFTSKELDNLKMSKKENKIK